MTTDRTEDAVHRDEQKAEHETLQGEVKRLREDETSWRRWLIGMTGAFLVAGGVAAGACSAAVSLRDEVAESRAIANDAINDATEAVRIAVAFRNALDAERARYEACVSDRDACIDVGNGWALCMPGGAR